ncbi:unnamed protein product [Blepharisma stoltei]|uniref:Signal peptidase complex subunit 3 n=1 Tax=Blepharisma stoltei TaxID=1481888 RepID=A0AAU9IXF4_9CILI|nr:unnamed protein product [Blepharisma stoltei]
MGMMHNVTSRFNSSFFFGVTVIGILAAINFATSFAVDHSFSASISNVNVTKFIKNSRYNWDEAELTFNLNGNFSDIFNWNVKLAFFYVELEYNALERNQITLWDKIIWRNQNTPINLNMIKEKGKYAVRTKKHNLKGATGTVKLKIEVTPIVGLIYKLESTPAFVRFPNDYS